MIRQQLTRRHSSRTLKEDPAECYSYRELAERPSNNSQSHLPWSRAANPGRRERPRLLSEPFAILPRRSIPFRSANSLRLEGGNEIKQLVTIYEVNRSTVHDDLKRRALRRRPGASAMVPTSRRSWGSS